VEPRAEDITRQQWQGEERECGDDLLHGANLADVGDAGVEAARRPLWRRHTDAHGQGGPEIQHHDTASEWMAHGLDEELYGEIEVDGGGAQQGMKHCGSRAFRGCGSALCSTRHNHPRQ